MNDDFLTRMRQAPRREFSDELYARINKPLPERNASYGLIRKSVLAAAVIGLLLLLIVMVSPGARAFAEEQFRQIGALIFRRAETDLMLSEGPAASPVPTVPAPGDTNPPQNTTLLEDASRLAGFTVLAPRYLPEGYLVDSVWSIDRQESGIYVASSFGNAAKNQFLLLNQVLYTPGATFEQSYADNEQLSDINVRGKDGIWITGRLMTDPADHTVSLQAEPQLYATNWLVWQEGDITYALFGNGLNQADMIRIAESLDD